MVQVTSLLLCKDSSRLFFLLLVVWQFQKRLLVKYSRRQKAFWEFFIKKAFSDPFANIGPIKVMAFFGFEMNFFFGFSISVWV